ncbi:(2Fe-2S)-binding protein [Paenibacillus mesophilus]|uniref:(2Fe-2S)-binding protein n=1 Tax=Paenibacillus mesophilus TaxID=2582849 RepID=UPI001305342A|nr:(2Fe-2S)-binding protein [Paenibacillus mesophilus]
MDFECLQKFNVGLNEKEHVVYSVAAARLGDREVMEQLIEAYAPLIKALDRTAAATYFCNQFANACLALQYAVSVLGKSIDLSLDNMTVQLFAHEGKYGVAYKLDRWAEQAAPSDAMERRLWLERVLTDFYGKTVKPLYESAAVIGDVDAGQMWGLLPTRFNYMTEQWLLAEESESIRSAISDDYAFLKHEVPASVFGRSKNPLDVKIRWIEDLKDPCKQIRMKNVCCQYYRTEGGYYCYTCPRMKEADREERRIKARQSELVTT